MVLAVVISFLDEESHLRRTLESVARQTRPPDRLVLVDDGSRDGSAAIAAAFAERHHYALALRRDRREIVSDPLAGGAELRAFQWGLERVDVAYDLVAKLDADIELTPATLATLEACFQEDDRLGMAGAYLSLIGPDGKRRRERSPAYHVRGATRFYRRACYEQVIPDVYGTGWDTMDEVKARMLGWRTRSFEMPDGDPLHLRPTGIRQGPLRGFRRNGVGAYAYGAHPVHVLLGAANRVRDRPYVLGSLNYLAGWALGALRRVDRAEPEVRRFARREQLLRIRHGLGVHRRRTTRQPG